MDMVFSGRAAMGGGIASPSSVVAAAGNDALYAFCMQHIQLASHTTLYVGFTNKNNTKFRKCCNAVRRLKRHAKPRNAKVKGVFLKVLYTLHNCS